MRSPLLLPLLFTLAAEGIWHSPGYGYVLNVDTKQVQSYDISAAGCVEADKHTREAFESLYGKLTEGMLDRYPTRDALNKLPSLPEPCRKPLRTKDPLINFNVFASTLEQHYPHFKARSTDGQALLAKGRQRVQKGDDLFDTITEILKAIGDGHLAIGAGKRSYEGAAID